MHSTPSASTPSADIDPQQGTRRKIRFTSGNAECAGWYYPTANGACVVMAGGFAVTKEPATDLFAARLHAAGFGVLAFDYRRLGESGGRPRQIVRVGEQLADWQAAVEHAATLAGVDSARISVWGFSASGGHIFRVAARNPHLAAAIAQTPNAGGPAASLSVMRFQKPWAALRLTARGILDGLGGMFGRAPLLVPLGGEPGTVAVLTTPDVADAQQALDSEGRHTDWLQQVAARSVLRLSVYQPGRAAARIRCPLLVLVCDQDKSAYPPAALAAAAKAPRAEVVRLPGGHYAPFLASHEQAVAAQIDFLSRHLGGTVTTNRAE